MGMSNHNKQNALHLAALYASTEALEMLTAANLLGLDAEARDGDRHSPNECFLECRSAHCAVARKSFDVERWSWVKLMKSARRQTEVSCDVANEDVETGMVSEDMCNKRKDSGFCSQTNSGSTSEEEFVDLYSGDDAEDWPDDTR